MMKIAMALAATAATAVPLMAIADPGPAPHCATRMVPATTAPITIGLNQPILLKRMVVTATALPDDAAR